MGDKKSSMTEQGGVDETARIERVEAVITKPTSETAVSEHGKEGKSDRHEKAKELSEVVEKIKALEERIEFHKGSFIRKILDFGKIDKLREELGILKHKKGFLEENMRREAELTAAHEEIIVEEREYEGELGKIESAEEEAARLEKEDNEARSVKNSAKKYNTFFVHDIVDADWKPSENNKAVDTRQLSFSDQLDIVAGLRPTISASSLRPDTADWTFTPGSFGAFISRGKILGGEYGDMGSIALGLKKRLIPKGRETIKSIDGAINRQIPKLEVVTDRDGSKKKKESYYNELIIENPEVAGVYLKWYFKDLPSGESKKNEEGLPIEEPENEVSLQNEFNEWGNLKASYDLIWNKLKLVADRKIPLFVLTLDNHARQIYDIDFQKRSFRVSAEWDPSAMSYEEGIGEWRREEAIKRQIKKVSHLLSDAEKKLYEASGDS